MIQTDFWPRPEKNKPIKIIQVDTSVFQPIKVEEIKYRECRDVIPDSFVLYPTGGYHPFYGTPNTLPRYQLPIWPFIRRIKWPKQPRKLLLGHLKARLHPKSGYITITLQRKECYHSTQHSRNWSGFVPKKVALEMHGLVARAWIPNPDNKPFVLHINDDPTNYLPENLKWGTQRENMKGVKRHQDTTEQKYLSIFNKGIIKG